MQGGSSITQQLAKNLFLSNERTLQRKIKEAYLALWLEANLSKREILKLYLDRAYMGGGTFGVGAASEFYFGKKVQDLDLAECAMLAGLFKAPTKYAPHINLPAARARANEVLTNMVQAGYMTEGQVVGARRHPAVAGRALAKLASADYFLDWAFEQVKSHVDGKDKVLVARTTLDMRLQKAAEAAIESTLRGIRRAVQRPPGRARLHGAGRRDPRHGRRARLRRLHLQPRRQRAPPAGLLVQALCLCDGAGDREIHARHDGGRRAGLDRQLVAAELRPLLQGPAHAARRAAPVAEHRGGAALDRDRPAADRRSRRAHGRLDAAQGHPLAAARHRRS